jgi:hypothetical protein
VTQGRVSYAMLVPFVSYQILTEGHFHDFFFWWGGLRIEFYSQVYLLSLKLCLSFAVIANGSLKPETGHGHFM